MPQPRKLGAAKLGRLCSECGHAAMYHVSGGGGCQHALGTAGLREAAPICPCTKPPPWAPQEKK